MENKKTGNYFSFDYLTNPYKNINGYIGNPLKIPQKPPINIKAPLTPKKPLNLTKPLNRTSPYSSFAAMPLTAPLPKVVSNSYKPAYSSWDTNSRNSRNNPYTSPSIIRPIGFNQSVIGPSFKSTTNKGSIDDKPTREIQPSGEFYNEFALEIAQTSVDDLPAVMELGSVIALSGGMYIPVVGVPLSYMAAGLINGILGGGIEDHGKLMIENIKDGNAGRAIIEAGRALNSTGIGMIFGIPLEFGGRFIEDGGAEWNAIKAFGSGIWNGIEDTATSAWNGVGSIATRAWNGATNVASSTWNGARNVATRAWNGAGNIATRAWNGATNVATRAWNGVGNIATRAWNGAGNIATNAWNGVGNVASSVWNGAGNIATNAWNGVGNVASSVWNGAGNVVSSGVDGVRDIASSAWSGAKSVWHSIFGSANGRFVNGRMLSWIGEDGPEVVIPLSSNRRSRGLDLWEKAGEMMGVQKYANGGIVGSSDHTYSPGSLLSSAYSDGSIPVAGPRGTGSGASEVKVNVNVNPSFEIDSGEKGGEGMIEIIKTHMKELADELGSEMAGSLEKVFSNMPLKEA